MTERELSRLILELKHIDEIDDVVLRAYELRDVFPQLTAPECGLDTVRHHLRNLYAERWRKLCEAAGVQVELTSPVAV